MHTVVEDEKSIGFAAIKVCEYTVFILYQKIQIILKVKL